MLLTPFCKESRGLGVFLDFYDVIAMLLVPMFSKLNV